MIKFLKLTTMDEIIAQVKEVEDGYQLVWPMRVFTSKDDDGETQNRVVPFAPHVKSHTIVVSEERVVYMADPVPSLQEYYEKNIIAMLPVTEEKPTE